MEIKVKCPDCGKMMRVTIESEEAPKVQITTKQTRETTWEEIVASSDLKVGDEISCTLTDGTEAAVVVAAINPFGDGRNAYVFRDCIGEEMEMNDECTTKGGWRDSKMRRYIHEEIYPLLPDDLKAVIKPRTIKQKFQGEELESEDKLWLLSDTEVRGGDYDVDVGDVHFPLFSDEKSREKMNSEGSTWCYWLRSAYSTTGFLTVIIGGSVGASYATSTYGVALGFLA